MSTFSARSADVNLGETDLDAAGETKRREKILFFLLAFVIWPVITVGVVAGWGFFVWMYYMFNGPPAM